MPVGKPCYEAIFMFRGLSTYVCAQKGWVCEVWMGSELEKQVVASGR